MAEWTTDQIKARIRGEADAQNVDPDLALAVAYHESGYDPNIEGDNGRSIGIFQLQPAAAIDVGVNPQWRKDPGVNIYGGVRYLKQKLDQSKGNVEEALSRYNRGTPDYRGIGDPNYVQRVMRYFKPGIAEAAEHPQAGTYTDQDVQQALQALQGAQEPSAPQGGTYGDEDIQNALKALQGTQEPSPAPPTATSTPAQDAAYRASRGQQGTPMRLSLGDPTGVASAAEAAATIAQMRASQAGAAGVQPRPADLSALAVGGGPAQQAPPVTDPAALLAGGTRQAPPPPAPAALAGMSDAQRAAQGIELIPDSGAALVQDRIHEAGIPLSAVPAIAVNTLGTVGGAAVGALTSPVTGILGPAAGAAIGGSLATRANTALGLAPQEKPLLETPWANVYPSDLLGAIPLGIAGATAALKGTVRNLPGANVGRHEMAAEKLAELGQRVGPARPSSELFTEAASQGGAVPTPTLWRAAGKVVREEQGMKKGFVSTEAMEAGHGLMDLMRDHGGNVPLAEVEKYRQRLFQKIRTTTDKAELQRLQDLYGAIHEDLALAATAGTAAGAGTLKAAIAAKRKEHAQETLTDVWSPGKGLQLQEGNHTQIYGKRIRNEVEKRLHKDKLFAGSFTAAETVDIRDTLREVGKLTRMTNPDAQGAVGSTLKWLGRLGGAGGAGYGVATGDLSTLMTGGAMLLATEGTTAVLTNAMQSKVGRWALREAIREGNGTLTHGSLSAIAALVAREAAPDAPAPAPEQKP